MHHQLSRGKAELVELDVHSTVKGSPDGVANYIDKDILKQDRTHAMSRGISWVPFENLPFSADCKWEWERF